MSIVPAFATPCDLARDMPALVAEFLDLENRVRRRFREDSVTDFIVAGLLQIAGSNAFVLTPPESVTGGDFDILILDQTTKEAVQYRLQAKRVHDHGKQWEISSYKELAHPNNTGAQAARLVRSSAHEMIFTIPLYMFYNSLYVCAGSGDEVAGISLADGRSVNQIVKNLVAAKPAKPRFKRISYLKELFFPFETILCPGGTGRGPIVSPIASRQAVESAIDARRQVKWKEFEGLPALPPVEEDLRLPYLRRVARVDLGRSRRFPQIIEWELENPHRGKIRKANVRRPKLVLLA